MQYFKYGFELLLLSCYEKVMTNDENGKTKCGEY